MISDKLNCRKFFEYRLGLMKEKPLNIKQYVGPGKSSSFSPKCKLGGYRLLGEDELFLVKSFMRSMKNSPPKSKVMILFS